MNIYFDIILSISNNNKYLRTYLRICERAKLRASSKKEVRKLFKYSEAHHVLPISLRLGGSKDKDNIAHLTAKEHFIVHRLLVKFIKSDLHRYKMMNAVSKFMQNGKNQKRILTSRQYEVCRKYASECASYFAKTRQPRTKESIQKGIDTCYERFGAGSSRINIPLNENGRAIIKQKRNDRPTYDTWFINADPNKIRKNHSDWAKENSTFMTNNPSNTEEGKRAISLAKSAGTYITPFGTFDCRYDFDKEPTCKLIDFGVIYYVGLDSTIKTRAINRANLPKDWFGKSWRQVGFDLISKYLTS